MSNWKAALLIVIPLVVTACAGATYGQQAGSTTMPSMSMPATSAPAPATAPSVVAPPVGSPPAGSVAPTTGAPGATAGATLHISALNLAFNTNNLEAPAGQPFVIEFANNDPDIPHNIDILDASGASIFKGAIVNGPTTVSYQVPAIPPGTYSYHCDVHPFMTGTLTVK
jgi:plastocyanin